MAFQFAALMPLAEKLLSFIPDPTARETARAEMLKQERAHELELLSVQMSAIVAEAQSEDPWTSRARPSFLYVCYILILSSLPMGVLFWVDPASAKAVADGFTTWLQGIPTELYTLMGAGDLGYTGARSFDKRGKK